MKMGARQSVAQPSRHRTQSSSATALNGHSVGPSTSAGPGAASSTSNLHQISHHQQRLGGRQIRSQSVIVPAPSDQNDNSSDSSDDDGPLPSTGISALDRLLRLHPHSGSSSTTNTSGILLPPIHLRFLDVKCPVCHKLIPSDDVELHLVVCLTRPRISYNDDVLTEDKGECAICFEDMCHGDTIARLPCLCVYHKGCIDSWFKIKNNCPEHPSDDD